MKGAGLPWEAGRCLSVCKHTAQIDGWWPRVLRGMMNGPEGEGGGGSGCCIPSKYHQPLPREGSVPVPPPGSPQGPLSPCPEVPRTMASPRCQKAAAAGRGMRLQRLARSPHPGGGFVCLLFYICLPVILNLFTCYSKMESNHSLSTKLLPLPLPCSTHGMDDFNLLFSLASSKLLLFFSSASHFSFLIDEKALTDPQHPQMKWPAP